MIQEIITKYHFKEINPQITIADIAIGPPRKPTSVARGFCPIGIRPYGALWIFLVSVTDLEFITPDKNKKKKTILIIIKPEPRCIKGF